MKRKTTILFSDTHFGVKANSMTWLGEQMKVFYDDIIPLIQGLKRGGAEVEVICCGDLFDSRSSINAYVMYEVNKLLKDICKECDQMYVIGGNHDFYSPNEAEYNITSLDMLQKLPNLHIITQKYERMGKNLFIPWFSFENKSTLEEILAKNRDCKNVFCHTDLERLDEQTKSWLAGFDVVSGHIHKPLFTNDWLYTIGSLYALTFADANQDRYFYTIDNDDMSTIQSHPNTSSMKFWRIYNSDILDNNTKDKIHRMDQVELYIDKTSIDDKKYQDAIEEYNKKFNTHVIIIEPAESEDIDLMIDQNFDIVQMCQDIMPKKLLDKFSELQKKLIMT